MEPINNVEMLEIIGIKYRADGRETDTDNLTSIDIADIEHSAMRLSAKLREIDNREVHMNKATSQWLTDILEMLAYRINATRILLNYTEENIAVEAGAA